jgi:hypothetical protein
MDISQLIKSINKIHNPIHIHQKVQNPQELIDEEQKKTLRNVSTGFVVNNYLTDELLNKFLNVIIRIFNTYIEQYISIKKLEKDDIKFIYKGGNVYRMFILQYLDLLPGYYSRKIQETYKDIMKRSDADFQIMVNANLTNYDEIFENIENLSFNILDLLKNYFNNNNEKYFLFSRYEKEYKQSILLTLLETFQKTNDEFVKNNPTANNYEFISVIIGSDIYSKNEIPKNIDFIDDKYKNKFANIQQDIKNYFTSKRPDILIDFHNNIYNETCLKMVENNISIDELKNDLDIFELNANKFMKLPFYNSLNKTIQINSIGNNFIKFSLARIKLNFIVIVKLNDKYGIISLPGEFIDVSIPHKLSQEMIEHPDKFFEILDDYKFKDNVENKFNFQSYSDIYYEKNLEKMIFLDSYYPWNILKYQKRIKRYILLICLRTLKSNDPTNELINMININNSLIINPLQKINIKITDVFSNYITYNNKLIDNVSKIYNNNSFNKEEFKDYIKINIDMFTYLIDICKKLNKFVVYKDIFDKNEINNLILSGGNKI